MNTAAKHPLAKTPLSKTAAPRLRSRVLAFAHRWPLAGAVLFVAPLLLFSIAVFRPSYDTNDDAAISFIASGKVISESPDEHMVFTHFLVGLMLKRLYLWAPSVPWYATYLFSVHAAAHIALVYMLFKQRLGPRWLAVYLLYASVVGLILLTALQFTTTAFLAAQSGLLLGLFAFARAAEGDARLARRTMLASVLLLIVAALVRWHVFILFFSLALPAAGVLAWMHWRQRRLIIKAACLTVLVLAGLIGLAHLNTVYYAQDPRWSDFYTYNELRAKINDLAWVYYSPETAHVFPKVGWSVNDYGMIQSWFFDDPAVYGAAKIQELLDAHPWQETMPRQGRLKDLLSVLADDRQIVPLLALIPLLAFVLRRNAAAQTTLLLSCAWVIAIVLVTTVMRKPPPPRIYLPVLSFPLGLAVLLGAMLPACASETQPTSPDPASPAPQRRKQFPITLRFACMALATIGVISCLAGQYKRGRQNYARSEVFYHELAKIAQNPHQLYIAWGTGMPFELMRPTDNLQWLSNLRMVIWGWTQQCPFHRDMKSRFGASDLPRELTSRPDITLICHPTCLPLMKNYIREHHGREIDFESAGQLLTSVLARAVPAAPTVIASQHNSPAQ
ncbi:MAG TPA: hypothetical protein VJ809_08895 [Pirellulales bacterium]|nr:hypothetical protein [Pirellulales bacterium]